MDDLPLDLLLPGAAAVLLAAVAWLADRRRMRRSDPDAVGFMPWTTLFFWSTVNNSQAVAGPRRMSDFR